MICFVILHYQAFDETVNCINNIKQKVREELKIIIVDNHSPNGSGTALQKLYDLDSMIDVYLTEKNLGFAKGNNFGFKQAKQYNPDFVVVMNNDVLLVQDDLVRLLEIEYEKYNFDVLGPDIFSTKTKIHQNPQRNENYTIEELKVQKKKLEFKNKYKFLLKLKYLLHKKPTDYAIQTTDYSKVQFNIPLHGACYVFSKNFVEKHECCFYNRTFMYYESYILHYLGMREGLKFVYSPEIKVVHHEDVATNQTYDSILKKAIFVNQCLEDSCKCFIKVIEDKNIRIE